MEETEKEKRRVYTMTSNCFFLHVLRCDVLYISYIYLEYTYSTRNLIQNDPLEHNHQTPFLFIPFSPKILQSRFRGGAGVGEGSFFPLETNMSDYQAPCLSLCIQFQSLALRLMAPNLHSRSGSIVSSS